MKGTKFVKQAAKRPDIRLLIVLNTRHLFLATKQTAVKKRNTMERLFGSYFDNKQNLTSHCQTFFTLPYHILHCFITSYFIVAYFTSITFTSPCHILPYNWYSSTSVYLALPYPCPTLPYTALPNHTIPCLTIPHPTLSYHLIFLYFT